MVRRYPIVILWVLILLLAGVSPITLAFAEVSGPKATATLSANPIAMDETTVLTIALDGSSSDIHIPTPRSRDGGIQIIPSGRSMSTSLINGKVSNSIAFTYTVIPQRTGRHTIDAITGTVAGIPFSTPALSLEVTNVGTGSARSRNPWSPNSVPGMPPWPSAGGAGLWPDDPATFEPREDDLLLEAEVEPTVVYKHQPIFYNLHLLSAVNLLSDPRYNPVAPTGFLRVPFDQVNTVESRHNREYRVSSVKAAYFPLSVGTFTFDPTRVQVAAGSLGLPRILTTDSKTITVRPLPTSGRPPSFTGAVGEHFEISASLQSHEVTQGSSVELQVSVKGDGHLSLVPYPYLPSWPELEQKLTSSPTTTTTENGAIVSRRTYHYRLKPKKVGQLQLSPITLAYFNPKQERYQTIETAPLSLTVSPNPQADASQGPSDLDLPEADRPDTRPGSNRGELPELPLTSILLGGLVLIVGLALARAPLRSATSSKVHPRVTRNHSNFEGFLLGLDALAPEPDQEARAQKLLAQGWSPTHISCLEALRHSACQQLYGGASNDTDLLKKLNFDLRKLLKEVPS